MKSAVLIIAAPFGFGPAAKALIIEAALRDIAHVTFSADGDAAAFLERHQQSGAICIKGRFSSVFSDPRMLEAFDWIISVNHEPAISHLGRLGLAGRGVFVDSLLAWRSPSAPVEMPPGLSAYLVQDYPGAGALLTRCHARTVALTSPIIWPLEGNETPRPRAGITLHFGGIISPIATWESVAPAVLHIAREVVALARRCRTDLTILGSARLRELPLTADNVRVLGDVSPAESARQIASALLVVSTPGIGAVYEAITHDTPVVVLPAMNSTQMHHYRVLTRHSIPGAAHPDLMTRVFAIAAKVSWDQQTRLCLKILQDFPVPALSQLTQICLPLVESDADPQVRERHLDSQRTLLATLSKTDPIKLLRRLAGA